MAVISLLYMDLSNSAQNIEHNTEQIGDVHVCVVQRTVLISSAHLTSS